LSKKTYGRISFAPLFLVEHEFWLPQEVFLEALPELNGGASICWHGRAFQPGCVGFLGGFSGSKREGFEDGFFFGGLESESVCLDEKCGGYETSAFVPIEKRVVFDDAVRVGGSHLKNTWLAVGEEVLGPVESGIEQRLVAYTR
jgi:hypothetical protein